MASQREGGFIRNLGREQLRGGSALKGGKLLENQKKKCNEKEKWDGGEERTVEGTGRSIQL